MHLGRANSNKSVGRDEVSWLTVAAAADDDVDEDRYGAVI